MNANFKFFVKLIFQGCEPVELKEAKDEEEGGEDEEPKKEEAEKEEEETDAEPKPTPVSRTTQLLKAIKAPLVAVWPKRNKVGLLFYCLYLGVINMLLL